jgi:AcrR family transcriptional regulator
MRTRVSDNRHASDSVRDRRVRRTRKLLHEALGTLIAEKPYDAIAVQEIIDRADVGRSTFYTHFRDKDELLAESIRDMLPGFGSTAPRGGRWYENIIAFSQAIFEHLEHHRRTREAKMGARGRTILHEHLREVLAHSVREALERELSGGGVTIAPLTADLLALYVASTFVLVLNSWTESLKPSSARDVDRLFRALVLPTLCAIKH